MLSLLESTCFLNPAFSTLSDMVAGRVLEAHGQKMAGPGAGRERQRNRQDPHPAQVVQGVRAGCHQGLHYATAVLPGAASCLSNLMFGLDPVLPFRLNKMIVEVTPAGVHIGIAGVPLLGLLSR